MRVKRKWMTIDRAHRWRKMTACVENHRFDHGAHSLSEKREENTTTRVRKIIINFWAYVCRSKDANPLFNPWRNVFARRSIVHPRESVKTSFTAWCNANLMRPNIIQRWSSLLSFREICHMGLRQNWLSILESMQLISISILFLFHYIFRSFYVKI